MSSTLYDVVVVGAGLCGLSSAVQLKKNGLRVLVLEARTEPGGRIRSVRDFNTGEFLGDLGPSWVWPTQQPVLGAWLDRLGVSTFRQYSCGSAIVDLQESTEPSLQELPEQADAFRIDLGTSQLVTALAALLDDGQLRCSHTVSRIDTSQTHALISCKSLNQVIQARHVIVALPPRIGIDTIEFLPELPADIVHSMRQTPTWMAQHAKVVILYRQAFWRSKGLSGRVFSHKGPLGELQDHCGPTAFPAALTGFLSWDAERRSSEAGQLSDKISEQLRRLFGHSAPPPLNIVIKDWARDKLVSTDADRSAADSISHLLSPSLRHTLSGSIGDGGKLWLGGSELASQSPGLIEGAFNRADELAAAVTHAQSI